MNGIYCRYNKIKTTFNWNLNHTIIGSPDDFPRLVNSIWLFLENTPLKSVEQKIIFLWLIICGTYPTELDIKKIEPFLIEGNFSNLANYFLDHPIFIHNNSSLHEIQLIIPDHGRLLVDISHTSEYQYTSGIQRVVRKLVQNLIVKNYPVDFIKFNEYHRIFSSIYPKSDDSTQGVQQNKGFLQHKKAIYDKIKFVLGESLSYKVAQVKAKIKSSLPLVKYYFSIKNFINQRLIKSGLRPKLVIQNIVLFNTNILIPELIPEGNRLDVWMTSLKHLENKSTVIIYDFIPIYNPEYCVIVREFTSYLKLLRHVNQISCISEFVASDAKNFVANIARRSPIKIATHYLGADFTNKSLEPVPSFEFLTTSKPVVLCVGTFEPRKNQLAIARAAVQLMKEGLQFKMVFFGNPGWLNGEILTELEMWKNLGFDIVLITSGSDALLDALFKKAKFSVFCSLVEGFGLPIVESIHYSKPCLISNVGSMIEIGNKIGGCIPVDSTQSTKIAEGMRELLTKDLEPIKSYSWPTWKDYATQIYEFCNTLN